MNRTALFLQKIDILLKPMGMMS